MSEEEASSKSSSAPDGTSSAPDASEGKGEKATPVADEEQAPAPATKEEEDEEEPAAPPVAAAAKGPGSTSSVTKEPGRGADAGTPVGAADPGSMAAKKSQVTQGSDGDAEKGGAEEEPGRPGNVGGLFGGRPLFGRELVRRKASEAERNKEQSGRRKKLGIMIGVYLPSIQNVFGVVMFLRLSWMVGMMGTAEAFLMVFLCCLCTFLTTLSVSAIATNGTVESGGTYFMISRSLGPHVGMACGFLFYLANAVAVAMYVVGAVEIFLNYMCPSCYLWDRGNESEEHFYSLRSDIADIFSTYNNHVRLYGTILIGFIFCIIALGVRFVQISAPFSLAGVIAAILAIYAGVVQKAVDPDSRPLICQAEPDNQLLYSKHCYAGLPADFSVDRQGRLCACQGCINRSAVPSHLRFNRPSGHACIAQNGTFDRTYAESYYANYTFCSKNLTASIEGIRPSVEVFEANSYSKYVSLDSGSDKVAIYERRASKNEKGHQNQGKVTQTEAERQGFVFNTETTSFFAIMGIYFPSVTGILTGSNMSGDLKDPSWAIPLGTLAAQLTTSFVYLSFVLIFGSCVEPTLLLDKNGDSIFNRMVMGELAWPTHWIVTIGCLLSTFGAGLQSLCSAPRLLASMGRDEIMGFLEPFGRTNCWNEPQNALFLTTAIGLVCLMAAKLDVVAPFTAMFFLNLYAWVNLACAVSTLLGLPGWRPRFKGYHWSLSLFGFFLAYFIMFSTYWYFSIATFLIGLGVVLLVAWRGREKEWGDGIKGFALSVAQLALVKLEGRTTHAKNWRPQLLLINIETAASASLHQQLAIVHQLKEGRGLVLVSNLMEGAPNQAMELERCRVREKDIRGLMETSGVSGFAKAILYRRGRLGSTVCTLLQSLGLSQLRPNTIFSVWPEDWQSQSQEFWNFMDQIHRSSRLEMALICVKGAAEWPIERVVEGEIHIWWLLNEGGLLLLIAHLLRRGAIWSGASLHIRLVVEEEDPDEVQDELEAHLYKLRIHVASVKVMPMATSSLRESQGGKAVRDLRSLLDAPRPEEANASYMEPDKPSADLVPDQCHILTAATQMNVRMREESEGANLLILNLPPPPLSHNAIRLYMTTMDALLDKLPRALLVRGTGQEVVTAYQ